MGLCGVVGCRNGIIGVNWENVPRHLRARDRRQGSSQHSGEIPRSDSSQGRRPSVHHQFPDSEPRGSVPGRLSACCVAGARGPSAMLAAVRSDGHRFLHELLHRRRSGMPTRQAGTHFDPAALARLRGPEAGGRFHRGPGSVPDVRQRGLGPAVLGRRGDIEEEPEGSYADRRRLIGV